MKNFNYDVEKHGMIKFIKIYNEIINNDEPEIPMAKLYFTKYSKLVIIRYNDINERNKFKDGFNSNTLIYDTRILNNLKLKRFLNK